VRRRSRPVRPGGCCIDGERQLLAHVTLRGCRRVEFPRYRQRLLAAVTGLRCPAGQAIQVQQISQDFRLGGSISQLARQLQRLLRQRLAQLGVEFGIGGASDLAPSDQGGEFLRTVAALASKLFHLLIVGQRFLEP